MVEAIAAKAAQSERLLEFIRTVRALKGILTEFDERRWSSMVDFVTVGRGKRVIVSFRDGSEIEV